MTHLAPTVFPRMLFLLWSFCTIGLATLSPSSLTAVLAARANGVGDTAAVVFLLCFVVLVVDMVINDFLPDSMRYKWALEYRWLCVSSMSIVYRMFGTIALLPGAAPEGSWILILSYFGIGAWGMAFAFQTKLAKYTQVVRSHEEHELA